jgi:hypothetical protein
MRSAENKCGRALEDAPAVHWKPLTASSRGGNSCRGESLDAALQSQSAMKPKFLNSIFKLIGKILPVKLAKDQQGVKPAGSKRKVSRYGLHQAGALQTTGRPSESEVAALMAYDRGDPASLDELVEKGYVFGTLEEVFRRWHEVSLRDAGFPGKRECVCNEEPREDAICNSEIGTTDDEGWVKIATYGVHPGSVAGRDQHFYEEDANAVVGEFNSLRGRLGRMFRGIPIYIGHPDSRPDLYTDHRRLGKYTDLQARPDGLWAKEELNSLGLENKREGYWMYPSPRWDAPAGRPLFRPSRLISVGLTNSPRLLNSEPVANSTLDSEDSNQNNTTPIENTTIMDRKLLTEKLGLDVTATDEEILAKLASLMSERDAAAAKETEKAGELTQKTGELEAASNSIRVLNTRITTLETDLTQARETVANGLLDTAVQDGRISQADRAAWLPRLTGTRREEEANTLAALKPAMNTKPIDVTQSRVEIGDEKGRRETIANAVDGIMKTKGVNYDDAWELAKKDPALKPVWEAMKAQG